MKLVTRFNRKSRIWAGLESNRGSLSIEAIISATCLFLLIFVMSMIIRSMYTYDSVEHSLYNAAKEVSVNEPYILLAQSNGLLEQVTRPLIVKGFVMNELRNNQLYDPQDHYCLYDLSVKELSGFEKDKGAGTYLIEYKQPLPGGLPDLELSHQIRIKSIWQPAPDTGQQGQTIQHVYTTPHGRANGIYHTEVDCSTMTRSWKKPDSVQTEDLDTLTGYRQCLVCKKIEDQRNNSQLNKPGLIK